MVAASLVGCSVAFLCTSERWRYPLAALAIGLALGTKLTVALALPALLLIAIKLVPRRDLRKVMVLTLAAFLAFGAFGYVLNVAHTGAIQGDGEAVAMWSQHSWVGRAKTLVDVSVALAVVVDPRDQDNSYFGALGLLVVIPVVVIALRRSWRARTFSLEAALALSVPMFVIALAYTSRFNDWMGRFMLIPVVLAAPLAALLYSRRRYAVAVAAAGIFGLFFSVTDDRMKPSGFFGHDSVWTMTRSQEQARRRPGMLPVLNQLESIPTRARVGYSIGEDDWDYPLYGPRLERTLVRLPSGSELTAARRARLRWVIVSDDRIATQPHDGWKVTKLGGSGIDLLQPANQSRRH